MYSPHITLEFGKLAAQRVTLALKFDSQGQFAMKAYYRGGNLELHTMFLLKVRSTSSPMFISRIEIHFQGLGPIYTLCHS